ncbi:MAG: Spy/CpxP family protein refolding chaperone [Candidatus Obscuribacterales bacterium]|jgi:Spy/CpxP family protein refolding chaperone
MNKFTPLALSGLLFCALPAIADDSASAGGARSQTAVKVCAPGAMHSKLKISDEQKDKLSSIRDQYKLATAQKKAELEVAMSQQRQLMSKTVIDKSAVLSLQSKINGLKADLSNARIDMALTASAVFTPEQREMFGKFGKFGHGRGHGGPKHQWGGHRPGGPMGGPGGERKFG